MSSQFLENLFECRYTKTILNVLLLINCIFFFFFFFFFYLFQGLCYSTRTVPMFKCMETVYPVIELLIIEHDLGNGVLTYVW